MLTQLRAIFDIIVEFQAKQSHMYTECLQEVELRQQYNATGVAQTEKVVALNTHNYLCYGVPRFLKPLAHCTTTFAVAYQICSQQRFLNMKQKIYGLKHVCHLQFC